MSTAPTEAIILAGGLGTRLRSAVPDLPKCMAPVRGKPFLAYVIAYLKTQGITHFIFALGYKSDAFLSFLDSELTPGIYTVSVEPEPLGTGGAIQLACAAAKGQYICVTNGDTLFRFDLHRLADLHLRQQAECTLALKEMQDFDRYGVVETEDETGLVTGFKEKQHYKSGYINGGAYLLNKADFLQRNFPEKFSFEKDYLEKYFREKKFYGAADPGFFIDIGIPEDYERAQAELG